LCQSYQTVRYGAILKEPTENTQKERDGRGKKIMARTAFKKAREKSPQPNQIFVGRFFMSSATLGALPTALT
jgi:hypothetical protein